MRRFDIDMRGFLLLVIALAWLAGILIASLLALWLALPALLLLGVAFVVLFALIFFWRDLQVRFMLLFILFMLLGACRYTVASPAGDHHAISIFSGFKKLEVQGFVADEPTLTAKSRILTISVSSVSTNGGASWQAADGEMQALTLGSLLENPYGANFGDTVQLQGTLQPPLPHSSPEIWASMAFPQISVSSSGGNPILKALFQLRLRFATIIEQSLPQPEAALLIAILLGLKTPAILSYANYFNETGTAHLIAPSGFKVTILAGLVSASTRWLYQKRASQHLPMSQLPAERTRLKHRQWLATALTVGCIAAYTVISGTGPAAIRAGIMGSLLVIAPRIGRVYNMYTALAASAIIMSAFDPYVLWDVGFLLSFSGTLSIMLFTPFFQHQLRSLERLPLGVPICEISAVTLAAQIGTIPIIALTFNTISYIAPVTNVLTVPLLEILIVVGFLICITGFVSISLSIICGWIVYPFLWYVITAISLCTFRYYCYMPINNPSISLSLGYYGILALITGLLFYIRPELLLPNIEQIHHNRRLSKRTWLIIQASASLIIILATGGATALASRPDGQLSVTFLNVGPAGQQPQGESILIHTPDGKYALIDGGLDATSLATQLDGSLPPWQRSLDLVVLTSPRTDHLNGLLDVISRYQVGEVVDAGMLNPSSGYALWRRIIAANNMHYMQIRQGMTIAIGTQVALQVFWPEAQLHSGSTAELDNGLILRLIAPGLRMLLLGAASMSKYALEGLMNDIAPTYLASDVVQLVSVAGKPFPAELSAVLQAAHPSLLVLTPALLSAKDRKAGMSSVLSPLPPALTGTSWQIVQTAQVKSSVVIDSNNQSWELHV
jgi:competence protein ComEC